MKEKREPTIKEFRHKMEMPLLIFGYVLTALVVVGCIIVIATGGELKAWSNGILIALVAPVAGVFALRYLYFKKISNGVEMTKKQFSEMYNMYEELAVKMGFSKDENSKNRIPPLYLLNGNGIMNAFAAKCAIYDRYIVLNSDIVDVAYVHGNFEALKFVLAHELAHVKCNHIEFKRLLVTPIMTVLFF